MEKPAVSVIVPVYKVEAYLDRCVESILRQTFDDFEIILVDDGSPDKSPEMCDAWAEKDARIQVIHKENGGASAARNAGLRSAAGQFIAFVDSDDWIEPHMFERLVGLIRENDADMCLTDFRSNDGQQTIRQEGTPRIEIWDRKKCLDRFFRVNGEDSHYYMHSCLFRRDFLEGFSFEEGRMNEDVLANYWFAVHCKKAVHTDEPLYNYFVNKEGVTRNSFSVRKMDLLYIWDLVAAEVPALTPEYAYACEMNRKRAYFTLLSRMYIDGYDKKSPELVQLHVKLKKKVRFYYWDLMRWKMPVSRKALLTYLVL